MTRDVFALGVALLLAGAAAWYCFKYRQSQRLVVLGETLVKHQEALIERQAEEILAQRALTDTVKLHLRDAIERNTEAVAMLNKSEQTRKQLLDTLRVRDAHHRQPCPCGRRRAGA